MSIDGIIDVIIYSKNIPFLIGQGRMQKSRIAFSINLNFHVEKKKFLKYYENVKLGLSLIIMIIGSNIKKIRAFCKLLERNSSNKHLRRAKKR